MIGVILGRVDGKMVDISNCFPMNFSVDKDKEGDSKSTNQVIIMDTEYLKKMIKFHRTINKTETVLGVYISSTKLDIIAKSVIGYFRELIMKKEINSPLAWPILLQYDPTL